MPRSVQQEIVDVQQRLNLSFIRTKILSEHKHTWAATAMTTHHVDAGELEEEAYLIVGNHRDFVMLGVDDEAELMHFVSGGR